MINSPTKPKVDPKDYRKPMVVRDWWESEMTNSKGLRVPTYYAKCPRCGYAMERDYVKFCDQCGQKLAWQIPLRKNPR